MNRAIALVMLLSVVWSLSWPLIKYATFHFWPVSIVVVRMAIAGVAALMANADNISCYFFPKAFVKNKIFPDEFGLQSFGLHLPGIINYATI